MTSFEPSKEHLRHALLLFFNQNKSAAESHRLLLEITKSMHHELKHANTGLDDLKVVISI